MALVRGRSWNQRMIGRHRRKSEPPDGERCQIAFSVADAIRKENRKDLQAARAKCARATEQIKLPHPPEALAVVISKKGPGAAEVFLPGEKGRVVVRADIPDVFNDENAFRSACK